MGSQPFARLALLGAVAVFTVLALGNGLDRAAARNPALAAWVPAPLRAEAWRAEAAVRLRAGDMQAALAAAHQAVQSDPVDPRSAALLGAGQLGAGRRADADRTFRVAAGFGWRDPLTQLYFMNVALSAGQPRLAALRLDAVLRQAPELPVRDMLIAQFAGLPDRRAALAERLALRPPWSDAFVRQVGQVPLPDLVARAELIGGLARPAWGCDAIAPLTARLIQAGGVVQAQRLWLAHCPTASTGVADPRFTARIAGRAPIPFEWNLPGSGDVSAAPAWQTGTGTSGLVAQVSGASPQPVAWQLLVLAPGRYRLSWTAEARSGAARGAELSLTCNPLGRSRILGAPVPGGRARFAAVMTVDAACPGHYLTLWLAPDDQDTRFDALAIAPL